MSLNGIFCPVTTSFSNNRFDDVKFVSNLEKLSVSGLAGFVALGSTGEAVLLRQLEREAVVRCARESIPETMRLIAGTGGESTDDVIESAARAAECGADSALVLTPAYYKNHLNSGAYIQHFQKVADKSPIPVILYNVPKFTGLELDVAVVRELSGHSNIAGIKESTADISKLHELMTCAKPGFQILVGNAGLLWDGMIMGASGAILALANFAAAECVEVYNLVLEQKYESARQVFIKILPLAKQIVGKYGVPGIKTAMDVVGLDGGSPRQPLQPVATEIKEDIEVFLKRAGLL